LGGNHGFAPCAVGRLGGCIVPAGCNGSNNVAETGDTSGTFAERQEGTLVGGKCGITAGVKQIEVLQGANSTGKAVLVTPHLSSWDIWGESTPLQVGPIGNKAYTIKVSDYYHMSYLSSNALYTRAGGSAILNRANIGGITLRRRSD
jgi:hypothetical protein